MDFALIRDQTLEPFAKVFAKVGIHSQTSTHKIKNPGY